MTDFGEDLAGVDDLDAALSFVDGTRCWAEAVLCRLGNVAGTTEDDPTDGYDLTMLIGSVVDTVEVERNIVAQAKADERTETARAQVRMVGAELVIALNAEAKNGATFDSVLSVSEARLQVVELNIKEAA